MKKLEQRFNLTQATIVHLWVKWAWLNIEVVETNAGIDLFGFVESVVWKAGLATNLVNKKSIFKPGNKPVSEIGTKKSICVYLRNICSSTLNNLIEWCSCMQTYA